jgi:hypothetical protein
MGENSPEHFFSGILSFGREFGNGAAIVSAAHTTHLPVTRLGHSRHSPILPSLKSLNARQLFLEVTAENASTSCVTRLLPQCGHATPLLSTSEI